MLTDAGKKVIAVGIVAGIAYYVFGPVGLGMRSARAFAEEKQRHRQSK